MKKSRLSEERIIEVLRQLEAGRKVSQLKRLKEIEEENRRLDDSKRWWQISAWIRLPSNR